MDAEKLHKAFRRLLASHRDYTESQARGWPESGNYPSHGWSVEIEDEAATVLADYEAALSPPASQPQAAGVGGDALPAQWRNRAATLLPGSGARYAYQICADELETALAATPAPAAPPKLHYCGDEYLREIVRDEFALALLAAGIQFMPGGYMDAVADEVVRRAFDPHEERLKEPEDDGTSKYAARRAEGWHAIAATRWQAERNTGDAK